MSVDFNEMIKDPVFASLPPETGESLVALANKISGKPVIEAMPHIMEFMKSTKNNAPIDKKEQQAMIAVMLAALPEDDRKRFGQILSMMNLM